MYLGLNWFADPVCCSMHERSGNQTAQPLHVLCRLTWVGLPVKGFIQDEILGGKLSVRTGHVRVLSCVANLLVLVVVLCWLFVVVL